MLVLVRTMRCKDLACAVALSQLVGCAGIVRDMAEEATPAVVEGGVKAISDPETQQKLVAGIDERVVGEGTDRLVSGLVDGTLASIGDPVRRERLRQEIGAMARGFSLSMSHDGVNAHALGDVVDESISRLSSPENQAALRSVTRSVMADAIAGAFEQTSKELGDTDVTLLMPVARELSKQAALGVQDAVTESQQRKDAGTAPDQGNVLAAAGEAAESGSDLLWVAIAGLVVFGAAVLGTIVWAARRQRGLQAELHRRDDVLLGLVASIAGRETAPTFGEVESVLREVLRKRRHDGQEPGAAGRAG